MAVFVQTDLSVSFSGMVEFRQKKKSYFIK